MKRSKYQARTEDTAIQDVPRAMADLLEVCGVVDRACNETSLAPTQFLEASRAIHRALLALHDWSDVVSSSGPVVAISDRTAPSASTM